MSTMPETHTPVRNKPGSSEIIESKIPLCGHPDSMTCAKPASHQSVVPTASKNQRYAPQRRPKSNAADGTNSTTASRAHKGRANDTVQQSRSKQANAVAAA